VLGLAHQGIPLTAEIYARTSPNLMDLMIGVGGGAAGAYAMTSPRLSVAFVGVAIATALVPPFASSAVCLNEEGTSYGYGPFLVRRELTLTTFCSSLFDSPAVGPCCG
jgi:uncharacterized membrane protein